MRGECPIIDGWAVEFDHAIAGLVAVLHDEIVQSVRQCSRAMHIVPEHILDQVCDDISRAIMDQIHTYFASGAGATAIRREVTQALVPVAELLAQGMPLDHTDEEVEHH